MWIFVYGCFWYAIVVTPLFLALNENNHVMAQECDKKTEALNLSSAALINVTGSCRRDNDGGFADVYCGYSFSMYNSDVKTNCIAKGGRFDLASNVYLECYYDDNTNQTGRITPRQVASVVVKDFGVCVGTSCSNASVEYAAADIIPIILPNHGTNNGTLSNCSLIGPSTFYRKKTSSALVLSPSKPFAIIMTSAAVIIGIAHLVL